LVGNLGSKQEGKILENIEQEDDSGDRGIMQGRERGVCLIHEILQNAKVL